MCDYGDQCRVYVRFPFYTDNIQHNLMLLQYKKCWTFFSPVSVSVLIPAPEPSTNRSLLYFTVVSSIFSLFCFNCKEPKPGVTMKKNGTMVTVRQSCSKCIFGYVWQSQPFVLNKYPAGNILLSFSVLMAGASISKILLVFRHMGLCAYTARSFFSHQRNLVFPTILHYWESYQAKLITQLKAMNDVVWCGDGRFDSMGHSAKYGMYTMLSTTVLKIVHFEVVQVGQNVMTKLIFKLLVWKMVHRCWQCFVLTGKTTNNAEKAYKDRIDIVFTDIIIFYFYIFKG